MTIVKCKQCRNEFDRSVMPQVLEDTCPWCLGWRTVEDFDRAYQSYLKNTFDTSLLP